MKKEVAKISHLCFFSPRVHHISIFNNGQLPEWSNGLAWKASVRENVPRVRIPHCPPFLQIFSFYGFARIDTLSPHLIDTHCDTPSGKFLQYSYLFIEDVSLL